MQGTPQAVVEWAPRERALFALLIPTFGGLSYWSFVSTTHPSPRTGYFCAFAVLLAVVAQVQLAVFRITAGPEGLAKRSIWGDRHIAWGDVREVVFVAQDSATSRRLVSAPEQAFHIIVYSRTDSIAANRWMTGVDALVDVLRSHHGTPHDRLQPPGLLDRRDSAARAHATPSPVLPVLNKVAAGAGFVKLLLVALILSWISGLILVVYARFSLTSSILVDSTLAGALPWFGGLLVFRGAVALRRWRFGPQRASIPLAPERAVLLMAAAIGGTLCLLGFVPRALSSHATVDIAIVGLGVFFWSEPIREVVRWLRTP